MDTARYDNNKEVEKERNSIKTIRLFIQHLDDEFSDYKKMFSYLNRCRSIEDIISYYADGQTMYNHFTEFEIKSEWNELISFLDDQNYLVEITKIEPKSDNNFSYLLNDLKNMKKVMSKKFIRMLTHIVNQYLKDCLNLFFSKKIFRIMIMKNIQDY